MSFFRSLFRWLLVVVLLVGVAGLGVAYWAWSQGDVFLRDQVTAQLQKRLPEWSVDVGSARVDWRGHFVYVDDIALGKKDGSAPLVILPEVVLAVDGDQLTKHQIVEVKRVWLKHPQLSLIKDLAGKWNWEDLPPIPKTEMPSPELVIEQGRVAVQMTISADASPVMLECDQINVELIPSGKRQYLIAGNIHSQPLGQLGFKGKYNLDTRSYQVKGAMKDIAFNDELIRQAESVSPEAREKLAQLNDKLRSQNFVRTAQAGASQPNKTTPSNSSSHALGGDMSAMVDVDFEVSQAVGTKAPVFNVSLQVRHGNISHELLPFDLHDVSGDLQWNNQSLVVRRLVAKHGETELNAEGTIHNALAMSESSWDVQLRNLPLDDRLERRLTPGLLKLYRSLQPTGTIDLKTRLYLRPGQKPVTENLLVIAKNCTATHVKFPYTARQVVGTVRQTKPKELMLDFEGLAGQQKVGLKGKVVNPGPAAEVYVDVTGDDVLLDETAMAACRPDVRRLLERIGLACRGACRFQYYRYPGVVKRFRWRLNARVRDGQFHYANFPYALNKLTGDVSFDTEDGIWHFKDVKGMHGDVPVECEGSFLQKKGQQPGLLKLTLNTQNAPLDDALRYALPAPIQSIWDDFSPTGRLNLTTKIFWQTDSPFVLRIPHGEIHHGTLRWKHFAIPLRNVQTVFRYEPDGIPQQKQRFPNLPNQIQVKRFRGEYEQTVVNTQSENTFVAWQNGGRGEWEVRTQRVDIKDLNANPGSLFRRVLTGALKDTVNQLNPHGAVSLSGMLNFRGTSQPEAPVTAGWQLNVDLSGNKLSAGADLSRVYGRVKTAGVVDHSGRVLMDEGNSIQLSSVNLLDYQITNVKGPFQLVGNRLTVGSPKAFVAGPNNRQPIIQENEHLTGTAIGAKLFLDGYVDLNEEIEYHLRMKMDNGNLKEYADRYLSGVKNVRGTIDGWMDLGGRGESPNNMTGVGQLRIRDAALYELPVFVQIFSALSFAPPDRSAFGYAFGDFQVKNQQFQFEQIDLSGNAIRLAGRGTVGFDGRVNLSFGSRLPRKVPLPVVGNLIDQLGTNWVGVEVRGTTSAPIAEYKTAPQFDGTMRRLLRTFDARDPNSIPSLMYPAARSSMIVPLRRSPSAKSGNQNVR